MYTVKDIAQAMGITEQSVRLAARDGALPFMSAVKREGKQNYSYFIFDKKAEEYLNLKGAENGDEKNSRHSTGNIHGCDIAD